MKLKKYFGPALVVLTAVVNIVSWFFLPEKVAIQLTLGGGSNYASKYLFLIVSFLIVGVLVYAATNGVASEKRRWLITASIVAAVNIIIIAVNLLGNV